MTIDGFLTFFGFLAAGFALLDAISKLRLLLHFKRQLFWFLFSFFLIGTLLLPENPSKSVPSYYPRLLVDFVGWADVSAIGVGGTAFLLLITWAFVAVFLYRIARPTASSLKKLNVLADRLATQERFLELVEVVKPYLPLISKSSKRDLFFQRTHDWVAKGGPFALSISDCLDFHEQPSGILSRAGQAVRNWLRRVGKAAISPLASLVPAQNEVSHMATDLEVLLLRSAGLRDFLTSSRADFIIDLMKFDRFSTEEFVADTVKRMMTTPNSHFFRELKLMDARKGMGGFVYEEQLVLMNAFVLDSEFACHHQVWKPIGDMAISLIREDREYRELLLESPPDDAQLYDDPTFCTVQFFAAMVEGAAKAGVEENMWLMYMSIISKELVDLHADWKGANPEDEFPTFAMRLVFEITCAQRNWIDLHKGLPDDNYHTSDDAIGGWDNASIVMWSVRDYAKTLRYVVSSSHLPGRFQIDRWSSYVRVISKVQADRKFKFLRNSLLSEAIKPHDYSSLGDLTIELKAVHSRIDSFLKFEAEDVDKALGIKTSHASHGAQL
jgi:hypothetical protein